MLAVVEHFSYPPQLSVSTMYIWKPSGMDPASHFESFHVSYSLTGVRLLDTALI